MNIKSVQDVVEVIGLLTEFKPAVRASMKLIEGYAPELTEILEAFRNWSCKQRIASIAQYEEAGMSKDQAIALVLGASANMQIP